MAGEQAQVLARDGNAAVVHLPGRVFPGVLLQGDTFAALQRQFADAAARLRRAAGDDEALDDLEYAVAEMAQVMRSHRMQRWTHASTARPS
jgi:hypothetical protein